MHKPKKLLIKVKYFFWQDTQNNVRESTMDYIGRVVNCMSLKTTYPLRWSSHCWYFSLSGWQARSKKKNYNCDYVFSNFFFYNCALFLSIKDQLEENCFLLPVSISLDETVIIKARGTVSPKQTSLLCRVTVLTDSKYDLQVNVHIIYFETCDVILSLYATSNVSIENLHYIKSTVY